MPVVVKHVVAHMLDEQIAFSEVRESLCPSWITIKTGFNVGFTADRSSR
jgi:hypothetical protein